MAVGSFVCTAIQGAQATVWLFDRYKLKSQEVDVTSGNRGRLWFAILPVAGVILTAVIGTALVMYHPKPVTVEVPVTIEKIVPCPPAKTGPATTRGEQSPANSGNGNPTTYGVPQVPPQKAPPQ